MPLWANLELEPNAWGCSDKTSCEAFLKWTDLDEEEFVFGYEFIGSLDITTNCSTYEAESNKVKIQSVDCQDDLEYFGVCQCYFPSNKAQ